MLEFLGRLVFQVIVLGVLHFIERVGQCATRAVVPFLSGGRILVEPIDRVVVERWHGLHRLTDGTPVVGQSLASALGCLFLALAAVIVLLVLRSL